MEILHKNIIFIIIERWKRGIILRFKVITIFIYLFLAINLLLDWVIFKDINNLVKFGYYFSNNSNIFDNSILCQITINDEFDILLLREHYILGKLLLQWLAFKQLTTLQQVTTLPDIITIWLQLIPYLHFIPVLLLWGRLLISPFAYFFKYDRFSDQIDLLTVIINIIDLQIDPTQVSENRIIFLVEHIQKLFIFDKFLFEWYNISNPMLNEFLLTFILPNII